MSDIRVRFAPSPTGKVHIGNIRAAIYNWLYARHVGGKFLLRVEDTDLERSTPEAIQALFECMQWLGLGLGDEPVFYQTKNVARHLDCVKKLLADGRAYEMEKTSRDGKTGKVIPKKAEIVLPELDFDYVPAYKIRGMRDFKLSYRDTAGKDSIKEFWGIDPKEFGPVYEASLRDDRGNRDFWQWHGVNDTRDVEGNYAWGHYFGDYWKNVESGELLYMPVIQWGWNNDAKADKFLPGFLAAEPRANSMYEICFDKPEKVEKMKGVLNAPGKPRVWINTMWDSLAAGRGEAKNASGKGLRIDKPDEVWGWAIQQGATMIQSDYGKECLEYLSKQGRHNLEK